MRLLLYVFLLAGQLALIAAARGQSTKAPNAPLFFHAKCRLDKVEANGTEHFSFDLEVGNRSPQPIELRRAEIFLASRGGFATSISELIDKDHALFGIGPKLGPSSRKRAGGLKLIWSFPVTHILFALEAVDDNGASHYSLEQLPIARIRISDS